MFDWISQKQQLLLSEMPKTQQIKELKQFFINMMDYTEQGDSEEIYMKLTDTMEKINDNRSL